MVKVMGSSNATPMAADRPGRQPMTMPMVVPAAMASRLTGTRALINPWPIRANVSNIVVLPLYLNSRPTGSLTLRNRVNAQ